MQAPISSLKLKEPATRRSTDLLMLCNKDLVAQKFRSTIPVTNVSTKSQLQNIEKKFTLLDLCQILLKKLADV